MELIKKTGLKDIHKEGRRRQCGIFKCPVCDIEVERTLVAGNNAKTCGTHFPVKGYKKLHWVWACMKQRCGNPKNSKYKRYGERGITVCKEWIEFSKFKKWALENGYREGLTIDRIDNDGDYEPSNCRFVTNTENIRNSSQTKLTIKDVQYIRILLERGAQCVAISKLFDVTPTTISCIKTGKTWRN